MIQPPLFKEAMRMLVVGQGDGILYWYKDNTF